jgi:uncharacterized membrane protein
MNRKPLIAAGVLLGIGLGGFLDGIVFHQLLQLHSMLSAKLPQDDIVNVKTSMVWDGVFHLFTWLCTAIGLYLLWHSGRTSNCPWCGRTLSGSLIMGWGVFNTVEGVIDHQVLGIHHVVEALGESIYDYLFLASGFFFILFGLFLINAARKRIHISYMRPQLRFNKTKSEFDRPVGP